MQKTFFLMTLKSDANIKEKMICGFKYDMLNLVTFHPTIQKSKNVFSMAYFCPKYMRFGLNKYRGVHLSWKWTVMQILNKPWPCSFKNDITNWGIYGLFLSKAYNVSARKFQRDYVSRHWKLMQNLKKNRLVTSKMT